MRNRGAVQILVLVIIGAVAVWALVPTWHLPAFLKAKPKVAQLSQADQELAAARAALAASQAAAASAQVAVQAARDQQLRYAQQLLLGTNLALQVAPASPEIVLSRSLASKAQIGLELALGKLPDDQRKEMEGLITEALSAKQAEVDAANAELAAKDKDLQATQAQKLALQAQIPPLQASVASAQVLVAAKEVTVQKAQEQVVQYAKDKAELDQKNGSLGTYCENLIRVLLVIGIAYLLIHYLLPCLAAEYPAASWLSGIYRFFTSIFSAHTVTVPPKPNA